MGETPSVIARPTQSQHPARAVIRTVFAFVASLALVIPVVVEAIGADFASVPVVATIVGVAAAVTRVLAIPQVNEFLQRWVYTSWLAANPAEEGTVTEDEVESQDFYLN